MRIANEILMYFRSLKRSAGEISLSDSIDTDKDGNALSLMDVISMDDDMLEKLDAQEARTQVREYMKHCLSQREAEIVALRYGLKNQLPMTQREIAMRYDISRSYVSRIEKRALKKLREAMEGGGKR